MTNAYAMRNLMELGNYNTSITRKKRKLVV